MALFAEKEEKIFGEILFDIVEETNIRRSSPGSKTRAIAQALSKKLGQMYKKFDVNIAQAFLDGAEGKYLDFIGDMMGVERLGEAPARVASAERNVKFYVDVGTFGDINGGSPITISAGTVVSTGPASAGVTYLIPYSVVLSTSESVQYVAAQATRTGSASNVGAKQLIYHNFIDYSDTANNTLKVTNEAEIVTGVSVETDTNYKFRIANRILTSERANLTAIRIAALGVPGVADIVLLPFHRGVGTYDLLIKATTPTVAPGLIAAVQETIEGTTAQGIVPLARSPKEIGFSMVGTLVLRKKLSPSEESGLINAVQANVTNYVNSLDIGEEFIVNEVVERVMSTSTDIKNVGAAGRPFDSMFIYTPTRLEDNKVRKTLIGDLDLATDERLIVENRYAGDTPILFRVA